jgi:hypothetical protein
MKKVFAFILLMCHMNNSMFLPQGPEEDQYDASGKPLDDINSVVEYFAVALGYDHTADDEDDDSGQNFHLVLACDYDFEQHYTLLQQDASPGSRMNEFPGTINERINTMIFDVVTPPPKA